ncbi:MAG: hypothetical protein CL424_08375 [Acidimicrobiaceae bacterium]|nr:hypothetical protein [Acidimicrobiaceae bacterium]
MSLLLETPDTVGMATASEFRMIATLLDEVRGQFHHVAEQLTDLDVDGSLSGPVRSAVDATLGVTIANLRTATIDLEQQALEARYRASVCDAYTEMYRRFLRSDDVDRVAPRRPASWVRYG